jgi:hypothetical protein
MAAPTLMHGSEIWILKKRSLQGIESVEMAFLRSYEGCSELASVSNHDTVSEFGIQKAKKER